MVTGQEVQASTRARDALPSPIRKLSPLADRAKASGVRIFHLNIGQPDIPAPRQIMDAIHAYDSPILPYAPSQGLPETIDAWRAYYGGFGVDLGPNELLVTSGGSEAVLFAMMAVADPGDELIVFEPTYANYFGFACMTSINIVPVATRPEDGYHLPSASHIESRIGPRTRAILFTTPGNPTGTVYSYDELAVLSDIAMRHNLFLISDETYREIVFEGPQDMSMLKVEKTADRTIVIDSVSKRFSVTGARIGCIAGRHQGVMEGVMRFAQARLSVSTVEQRAVVPLLQQPRPYVTDLVETYRRRRDVIYEALSSMPGVLVRKPEGAFYIQAVLPIDDCERFASWLLTDFRLDGETVMVSPGDGFYITPGMGKREVRFAFVLNDKALARSMTIMREALRTYPGMEM